MKELNLLIEASISRINLMQNKQKQIQFLNKEIEYTRIENQLKSQRLQKEIKIIDEKIEKEICDTNPIAFHKRKIHEIELPYEERLKETEIPTKAKPIQMNTEQLAFCKKELQEYLEKGLIRPSKSDPISQYLIISTCNL